MAAVAAALHLIAMDELKFSLEAFEGPLDLLLSLINKNKVSIYDIPIALIFEQYTAHPDEMRAMDMEVAGEFIVMAAELMLIKSRMLLPKSPEAEEEEDPRAALAAALAEKPPAFFLLTTGVSTLFVISISLLNDEVELLWLALVVLYCTTAYMILATAYLTGLNTNSFFFNPTILTKFTAISLLPDLLLTILSFSLQGGALWAIAGILGVCGVLLLLSLYFLRGIERKWGAANFV